MTGQNKFNRVTYSMQQKIECNGMTCASENFKKRTLFSVSVSFGLMSATDKPSTSTSEPIPAIVLARQTPVPAIVIDSRPPTYQAVPALWPWITRNSAEEVFFYMRRVDWPAELTDVMLSYHGGEQREPEPWIRARRD